MSTGTFPLADCEQTIEQLEAALRATQVYRQAVYDAREAMAKTPLAASLAPTSTDSRDAAEEAHQAAHIYLVRWFSENLFPGVPITLSSCDIAAELGHSRYPRYANIPLRCVADHIMATFLPERRSLAIRELHKKLSNCCSLYRMKTGKNTLTLHLSIASHVSSIRRYLYHHQTTQVLDVISAVQSIMTLAGHAVTPLTKDGGDAIRTALHDEFAYRLTVATPVGRLVCFKEHLALELTPQVSTELALFLAEEAEISQREAA